MAKMFVESYSTNLFDDPLAIPEEAPRPQRTQAFYCQLERILVLEVGEERGRYKYLLFSPVYGIRAAILVKTHPKLLAVYLTRDSAHKDLVFKEIDYDRELVQKLLDRKVLASRTCNVHLSIDGPLLFASFSPQLQFVPYNAGDKDVRFLYVESFTKYDNNLVEQYFACNASLLMVIYVYKEIRSPHYEELVLEDFFDDCRQALEQRQDPLADLIPTDPNCIERTVYPFIEIHTAFRERTPDSVIHQPFPLPKFECCVYTDEIRRWIERKLLSALHYEFAFKADNEIDAVLASFDIDSS